MANPGDEPVLDPRSRVFNSSDSGVSTEFRDCWRGGLLAPLESPELQLPLISGFFNTVTSAYLGPCGGQSRGGDSGWRRGRGLRAGKGWKARLERGKDSLTRVSSGVRNSSRRLAKLATRWIPHSVRNCPERMVKKTKSKKNAYIPSFRNRPETPPALPRALPFLVGHTPERVRVGAVFPIPHFPP